MNQKQHLPYGYHKPSPLINCLLSLKRTGISRGLTRSLLSGYIKKNCSYLDLKVGNTNYRLCVAINNTDLKIATSSKTYDKQEITFLKKLSRICRSEPNIFVDLGANTGYYTLKALEFGYSQIISVEANQDTFKFLNFNVNLNDHQNRIITKNVCVSEIPLLYKAMKNGDIGSCSYTDTKNDTNPILTTTFRQVLTDCGLNRFKCLKIDTEGTEDDVLSQYLDTASYSTLPAGVIIEHCHKKKWKKDVIDQMKNLGFIEHTKTRSNTCLLKSQFNKFM